MRSAGAGRTLDAAGGTAVLVGLAGVVSIAFAGPLAAGISLGILAGVAALLLLALAFPARVADSIFVALLVSVSIPLDKYFSFQNHVGGWPGIRFAVADVFVVLATGLAALGWLARRRSPLLPAALCVPYAFLLVHYLLSALGAPRRDLATFEWLAAIHGLAVAAAVAALFRRRQLGAVLAAVGALVVIQSAFALLQVVTGSPIGAGLFRTRAEVMQELLASGSVRLRPSGLFDHPIVFADFILVSLPILAAGALSLRRPLERAAAWGAFGVGLAGLALSLARGAWLSALLGAVVFVVLGLRVGLLGLSALRRLVVPVAVLGLLTGLAFGPLIWERVTQSQSGNFRVRLDLNDIAMAMLADNPVGGVGLNNFLPAMHRYDPKDVMRYFPGPAHNLYLLEAAEGGWPALLLLLATGSGLALWSLRRLSRIDDPAMRWLAVAILSGFAAFAVSQLADFSYRLEPLRTVLWAWAGLLVGAVRVGTGEERT